MVKRVHGSHDNNLVLAVVVAVVVLLVAAVVVVLLVAAVVEVVLVAAVVVLLLVAAVVVLAVVDDDFKALAKTCKQLRSLGMKHASNLSNYDRASNLITYDGLSAFAASCTHLNLPYGYFSTDFLTDIANNFKQLQSLNLWGVCTNDSVLEALYRLIANNYKVFLFPVLI